MKCSRTLVFQPGKSGSLPRRRFIPGLVCLLSLLTFAGSAQAQISYEGVADKEVYKDSASFIVYSEESYDYTVLLNGDPIATDVTIEISEPEYYELYVHRREQSSGAEDSKLVRFIVRATERGISEVGLPIWTPYPMIDSAAAEFTGAQLRIVTPAEYPQGLDIPVIARVEDQSGNRLGVIGSVMAAGFEYHRLQLLRGVGSVFLPAATEGGIISYTAQIQSLQKPKEITIEASTTWQTESGNINSNTDWGTNARIHIDGALTIGSSATLTIGPGSIIKVDPDLEIAVNGSIVVNGTTTNPVVFTAQDRNVPWGGFLFEASTSTGDFNGTIMTASGADSNWFSNNPGHGSSHRKDQCLFYLSNGARLTLTDCYLVANHGQAGHGEDSYLTMTGCLVQKCTTVGQYNGGAVILEDCALIEFPSATDPYVDADNDAIYLTDGVHSLTDCLIGWAPDDGIDAGASAAGSVKVDNCWFESFYHEAMAWSGPKIARVNDTVTLNCGQGIECGYSAPDVNAVHCLSTANLVGARFGDNYNWTYNGFLTVSNSLLLYNLRDVWGRNWDDWTVRLAQMDIQNNYLSVVNANYPNNTIWAPVSVPNHLDELVPFLPTPASTVGIALATFQDSLDITDLSGGVAVRLSTFTTSTVSVDYTIETDGVPYDSGTLEFIPGETVKEIPFEPPGLKDFQEFDITISTPVNAELTGFQQITVTVPAVPFEVTQKLIFEGDEWRYFKGTSEPAADWNDLSFDDASDPCWLSGNTGIGYEADTGYGPCIATNLADMQNSYWSVYARKTFTIDEPARLIGLTLHIDFDDGYIAYINGTEVHSQYPPSPVAYNRPASTSNHEASCGSTLPQYDISASISALVPGTNVLALQVHNTTISSSDFIFIPELSIAADPYPGDFEPDGDVDLQDFAVLALSWQSSAGGDGNYNPYCDINTPPDYSIDMLDLLVFVDNWLAEF